MTLNSFSGKLSLTGGSDKELHVPLVAILLSSIEIYVKVCRKNQVHLLGSPGLS